MHPSESQWREMLDEETDPHRLSRLSEHLSACDACSAVLAKLSREKAAATALLRTLDGPPSRASLGKILRRARRPAWRGRGLVAAGVALFLVTVAGATIRSGALHRLWSPAATDRSPVPSPAPPTPVQSGSSPNGIAFQPGDAVTIRFDAPQDAGDLLVTIAPDSMVSIVASDTVRYGLSRAGVRVANRGATADYRVRIPERLQHASIRVADRVVFTKTGSEVLTLARHESGQRYRLSLRNSQRTSP
jgi:hypothetical protein